jgi:predicted metal-dependent phosphoesterase TrpH
MEKVGILHCHSTYSYDAKLSMRELRELFVSKGISFVCMTEHTDEMTRESAQKFVLECDALSDDTFRFIPGFEVPYKSPPSGTHAHVLMIGMRSFYAKYAPTSEALLPWVSEAKFVVLAHPVRNHFEVDPGLLELIDGLEVWNQQYEGKRVPRTRSLRLMESLKNKKPKLVATGGVDFHRTEHFGAPFVTLNVETLSEDAVLEKLCAGAFTVHSDQSRFFGSLLNAKELVQKHWLESGLSVSVIVAGKTVNKVLAGLGLSLPKSLKQLIRRRL